MTEFIKSLPPLAICFICGGIVLILLLSFLFIFRRVRRVRRKGRRAERKVMRQLRKLENRDFQVFNDLTFSSGALNPRQPLSQTQIDHLVVSTRGIFVIETKGLTGHISGSEHSQHWQQKFRMSANSFYNPILQNQAHLRFLRKAFPEIAEADFVSVIVFTDAWCIDVKADDYVRERSFLNDLHIKRTFDPERARKPRWWQFRRRPVLLDPQIHVVRLPVLKETLSRQPFRLSSEEVEDLCERIRSLVENGTPFLERQARYVERIRETNDKKIDAKVCPRCGGELIQRQGEFGPFLGCSNYPQCRFVCSAAPKQ